MRRLGGREKVLATQTKAAAAVQGVDGRRRSGIDGGDTRIVWKNDSPAHVLATLQYVRPHSVELSAKRDLMCDTWYG